MNIEDIKTAIRSNSLSMNYDEIYDILRREYFLPIDINTTISIPFINTLCDPEIQVYRNTVIRIFRENYQELYSYFLLIKHPIFDLLVEENPCIISDCVNIHISNIKNNNGSRNNVLDVYDLKISDPIITKILNITGIENDSILSTTRLSLSSYEVDRKEIDDPIISLDAIQNILMVIIDKNYILSLENTKCDLNNIIGLITQDNNDNDNNDNDNNRLFNAWRESVNTYIISNRKGEALENYNLSLQRLGGNNDGVRGVYNLMYKKCLLAFQDLRITRVLIHNILLLLFCNDRGNNNMMLLYFAFRAYPIAAIFSINSKYKFNNTIPIEYIMDNNGGNNDSVMNYFELYKFLENNNNNNVLDRNRIINNIYNKIQSLSYTIYQLHTYSLLEEAPEDISSNTIIPNQLVGNHNALQAFNEVYNEGNRNNILNRSNYLDSEYHPTELISAIPFNHSLFYSFVSQGNGGNTLRIKPIIPKRYIFESLEAMLDHYNNILPDTQRKAILSILLNCSSNYMVWKSIFKKHIVIMKEIINSIQITNSDKKRLLEEFNN